MNHKTKSFLVVLTLVVMIVIVGVFVNVNEGITGGTVTRSIACYENKDCDDGIEQTQDICREAGTVNSICVNKPKE